MIQSETWIFMDKGRALKKKKNEGKIKIFISLILNDVTK